MAEALIRRLPRLRALSVVVLVVLAALAVAGWLVTRNVVADQERKLLQQRTEEASLYLSTAVSSVQTQLASLAATAAATHEDPAAFERSTTLLTQLPGAFTGLALVRSTPPYAVVASAGDRLGDLGPVRTRAVSAAADKVGVAGSLVATPLFRSASSDRTLGFAYASPTLPGAVVYAETATNPAASTTTAESQPFSELAAAVYAVPRPDADQLVIRTSGTGPLPLRGDAVSVTAPIGQGDPWLLVAKARHPLVGSVATAMPWALLAAGLLTAALAAGIVEALARRREYAVRLVDARTEELRESLTELASAQDQLVRQERLAAIGELASTIGHELRNPLGVLTNAVYLLRGDLGPEPTEAAQRHLATAEREISAATVIVSDLLGFARERQPVPEPVDLRVLVEEVLAVLPAPSGVTVERRLADVTVAADRDMLRQVLLNLVSNAYQAMPAGGTLQVTVGVGGGSAQIAVADTGTGITGEARQRLFEPFFTTKPRGVGLGLAVSRRLVAAHGGDITVDSEPGQGATFHVSLPMVGAARDVFGALAAAESR